MRPRWTIRSELTGEMKIWNCPAFEYGTDIELVPRDVVLFVMTGLLVGGDRDNKSAKKLAEALLDDATSMLR